MAERAVKEQKPVHTARDYFQLPEGAPYQLIGGKLVMSPAPKPQHQRIVRRLFLRLHRWVADRNLGEVFFAPIDVRFGETEVYQPDLIFVSRERLGIVKEEYVDGAPDLVVEVLSPSSAYYDLRAKKKVYEQSGVKEYWIVDPMEGVIEVYRNKGAEFELVEQARKGGKIRSHLLSGLEIDPVEIFEGT